MELRRDASRRGSTATRQIRAQRKAAVLGGADPAHASRGDRPRRPDPRLAGRAGRLRRGRSRSSRSVSALVSSLRRRRRELAVLKTLGFSRRQVRATVAWQASTVAAVGLVVGIPLGLLVGVVRVAPGRRRARRGDRSDAGRCSPSWRSRSARSSPSTSSLPCPLAAPHARDLPSSYDRSDRGHQARRHPTSGSRQHPRRCSRASAVDVARHGSDCARRRRGGVRGRRRARRRPGAARSGPRALASCWWPRGRSPRCSSRCTDRVSRSPRSWRSPRSSARPRCSVPRSPDVTSPPRPCATSAPGCAERRLRCSPRSALHLVLGVPDGSLRLACASALGRRRATRPAWCSRSSS